MIDVEAGQLYSARAPRRTRYVRIQQVRRAGPHSIYALVTECGKHGRRLRRAAGFPIRVQLTWLAPAWRMPPGYNLEGEIKMAKTTTKKTEKKSHAKGAKKAPAKSAEKKIAAAPGERLGARERSVLEYLRKKSAAVELAAISAAVMGQEADPRWAAPKCARLIRKGLVKKTDAGYEAVA